MAWDEIEPEGFF